MSTNAQHDVDRSPMDTTKKFEFRDDPDEEKVKRKRKVRNTIKMPQSKGLDSLFDNPNEEDNKTSLLVVEEMEEEELDEDEEGEDEQIEEDNGYQEFQGYTGVNKSIES